MSSLGRHFPEETVVFHKKWADWFTGHHIPTHHWTESIDGTNHRFEYFPLFIHRKKCKILMKIIWQGSRTFITNSKQLHIDGNNVMCIEIFSICWAQHQTLPLICISCRTSFCLPLCISDSMNFMTNGGSTNHTLNEEHYSSQYT